MKERKKGFDACGRLGACSSDIVLAFFLRSSSRFFEQKRDRLESKLRTTEKQTHNIATMWKIKGKLRENVNISLTLYLWCIKFLSLCVRYSAKKRSFPLSPLNFMAGSASSRGSKRGKSRFSHASLMLVAKREASVPSSAFNFSFEQRARSLQ